MVSFENRVEARRRHGPLFNRASVLNEHRYVVVFQLNSILLCVVLLDALALVSKQKCELRDVLAALGSKLAGDFAWAIVPQEITTLLDFNLRGRVVIQ